MDRFYSEFSEFDDTAKPTKKTKQIEYDVDENDPETYQPEIQETYEEGFSEVSEEEDPYL